MCVNNLKFFYQLRSKALTNLELCVQTVRVILNYCMQIWNKPFHLKYSNESEQGLLFMSWKGQQLRTDEMIISVSSC